MELMTYADLLEIRASKGIVKDYSPPNALQLQNPPSNRKVMLEMFRFDPVIWTALNLTADMTTYNGYSFFGDSDEEIKNAEKKFDEELDFDFVIKNIIIQMLIYGEAYLQVGNQSWREGQEVTEIHPLESSEISLKYDEHGEITEYVQLPAYRNVQTKESPKWNPEAVIYFRMHQIGSRVYSYNMMDAIHRSYTTRLWSNYYLENLFKNNIPKIAYFIEQANKEQRESFRENIIRAKTNPAMDIVGVGKATAQLLQYEFNNGFREIMQEIRKEVLMVTRVPPHWIGDLDGANRGIGESIVIPFETNVQKIQQIVSSYINKELMPKLGFEKTTFKFNPTSLMSEKSILGNAQILAGLNIEVQDETKHPVLDYLRSKGFKIPAGAKITAPMPSNPQLGGGKDPKTDKMTNNLDAKGVSDEGMKKIEGRKVAAT